MTSNEINRLPRISIVIATRDRAKDLVELLISLLNQNYSPFEIIIIDDSSSYLTKEVIASFDSMFEKINCSLKYFKGRDNGLPAARNLGIKNAEGDAILFLDDDTLLGRSIVRSLAMFFRDNSIALGIQPQRIYPSDYYGRTYGLIKKLRNAIRKVLMLDSYEKNKLQVRISGSSIFPYQLTKVISAQRIDGCCFCIRREVFNEFSFDSNLKRWGFMEDLDFSYRIYKKYPKSLYAIPYAKFIHKHSDEARLPTKSRIYMMTIYWFYIFFKDIFDSSIINLIAFLWALIGNLLGNIGDIIIKRKERYEWWFIIYLLGSYVTAFRNLKNIRSQKLEFFNKNL